MRYMTFKGKSKAEAFSALQEESKFDSRLKDARIIKETEEENAGFLGLKKETTYFITVGVPEHSKKNIETKNSFSAIEKKVIKNHTAKPSKEKLVEDTLFAINNVEKLANKVKSTTSSNQAITPPSFNAVKNNSAVEYNKLSQEVFELRKLILKQQVQLDSQNTVNKIQSERSLPNDEAIILQHTRWIERYLLERSFSLQLIDDMIEQFQTTPHIFHDKKQLLASVEDYLLQKIPAHNISLDSYDKSNIVFVGPCGSGKSLSLFKLSIHLAHMRKKQFGYLFIDQDKYGDETSLNNYAQYMQKSCPSHSDLDEFLDKLYEQENDFTFIDSCGKSPSDEQGIRDLSYWIESFGDSTDTHLTISASTKYSDLEYICSAYKKTNYSHLLITKLDESKNLGSILSISYHTRKPISFITTGQGIPEHFGIANIKKIIKDSLS